MAAMIVFTPKCPSESDISRLERRVSDRGLQFTSRVWQAFCKQLDINVSLSSGYHPESNGQVERLHQEIGCYIRTYCSREQDKWSNFLPWAKYAQNWPNPFSVCSSLPAPMFPWFGEPSMVPEVGDWIKHSERMWNSAHVRLQRAIRAQRIQADHRRRPHPDYQQARESGYPPEISDYDCRARSSPRGMWLLSRF